jgi:platelet-activating factor acetylhydrolase
MENHDPPYRDNVELEDFNDALDEEPDSPLPANAMTNQMKAPRWLSERTSRWRFPKQIPTILQPRFTWKYVFFSLLLLYIFYCFVRSSPLLASKLPQYTGTYDVGAIDIEVPLEKPRKISETAFKQTGAPAFEVETVLFRLYYPTNKGAISSKSKHPWIPKPVGLTAEGYAKFAHFNNFISRPLFTFGLWAIAGSITSPAEVDVPLLDSENNHFPVMVFSHGMASSRTDYTHYCGELASRGQIVAAIEHRDGSSPGSMIKIVDEKERRRLMFRGNELLSDPPMDDAKLKEEQLAFRQAEIEETINVLESIHAGRGDAIFMSNSRGEGMHLKDWEARLNVTQFTIGGHSYGATGALQALKGATSSKNIAIGGIALDPGKGSGPLNHDIDVPTLVIHSNSWSKTHSLFFGRPHFDTVKDLVQGVLDRVGASWFMTSIGTSHPSVTDAPLIEPLLLSWTTGATIDVKEGVNQYVKASMDFFAYLRDHGQRGILNETVTHPEYDKDERSEERKKEMSKEIGKYWQIHVAPP